MARKINIRLILDLKEKGMSRRQIAITRNISRDSVNTVFRIANEKQITSISIKDLSDSELYKLFFPEKHVLEEFYTLPDYKYIHTELKRNGVTLKLLWYEYIQKLSQDGGNPIGYNKFCKGYRQHAQRNEISNRLTHRPGYRCEVDWAGTKMSFTDIDTGEVVKVYLFVATLPSSQYSYCEPTLDMKLNTWLQCHINMYNFFKGVPVTTVCDNLKTGVTSHPKEGEIILNRDYEELANHYHTAIMPTRVRKPKDKASVEGIVGKVTTQIIARFRNTIFTSFDQLKSVVYKEMERFNKEAFQNREGSRLSAYKEELPFLQPLPEYPYDVSEWVHGLKVSKNCHIVFRRNYYSCPYQYRGTEVSISVSKKTLKIYQDNQLLTTHPVFPSFMKNRYSSHKEDFPDEFNQPELNDKRMKSLANKIGKKTLAVVEKIFEEVKFKEQAYNAVNAVLSLGITYGNKNLEEACAIALNHYTTKAPRHKTLRAILTSKKLKGQHLEQSDEIDQTGYIRGANYYKGE